jgi:hypothetical protein
MTQSPDRQQREHWAADLRRRHRAASTTVFECHEGWLPILDRLLDRLDVAVANEPPEVQANFRVVQVEQRFGHILIDLSVEPTADMKAALDEASATSATTCECVFRPS